MRLFRSYRRRSSACLHSYFFGKEDFDYTRSDFAEFRRCMVKQKFTTFFQDVSKVVRLILEDLRLSFPSQQHSIIILVDEILLAKHGPDGGDFDGLVRALCFGQDDFTGQVRFIVSSLSHGQLNASEPFMTSSGKHQVIFVPLPLLTGQSARLLLLSGLLEFLSARPGYVPLSRTRAAELLQLLGIPDLVTELTPVLTCNLTGMDSNQLNLSIYKLIRPPNVCN